MKMLCKAAAIVVVTGMLLFVAAWAYLAVNTQKIFHQTIGSLTDKKVSVQAIYPAFFSGVVLKGLSVDGLFTAAKVRADLDVLALLHHELRISTLRLDDLVVVWDLSGNDLLAVPGSSGGTLGGTKPASRMKGVIDRVVIRSGIVRILQGETTVVRIEKIRAEFKNVPLTRESCRSDFSFTASLEKAGLPFVGHFLKGQGWLNWAERAMDAAAQAVDDNGRVGVEARFVSTNNDLSVDGNVRLLSGQQAQASGDRQAAEGVVLGVLEAANADVEAEFSLKTQMDRVQLEAVHFKGNITTDLNSDASSSSIVQSFKAIAEQFLKDGAVAPGIKPSKE